jgi:hypothetical protein
MEIVEKRSDKRVLEEGLAPPSGISAKRRNPDATGEPQERTKCRYDQ